MENIAQMSLLEVALKIMEEKEGIVNIYDLIQEVLTRKGIEDTDGSIAAKLYVDITTSSKFVYMGEDNWDLKSRQSLEQFDKDGSAFNPRGAEDDDEDFDDLEEDDLEEDEDEDEDSDDESDEDEDEDSDDESDLDDTEYDEESDEDDLDDDESDDDRSIDEDKYNEYMDDYEDLYEA